MRFIVIAAITALCIPCLGQTEKAAQVFSARDTDSQLAALVQSAKSSGSSGAQLGVYPSHTIQLSARTASGGAEVHAHFDDIFVVTQGTAILITGGAVANAQTGSGGETKGTNIENGQSRTIGTGDIVHIPAGTPHQLIIKPGNVFSSIVVKVKE
jgi:mannose-6-phosphate isomerase-like protein (cupin superfamily)